MDEFIRKHLLVQIDINYFGLHETLFQRSLTLGFENINILSWLIVVVMLQSLLRILLFDIFIINITISFINHIIIRTFRFL